MTSQPTFAVAGRWILVIAATTVLFGAVTAAMHAIFGLVHWQTLTAYAVIGTAMAFAGWGGTLLMHSAISRSFVRSGSVDSGVLRIALSSFAGALGYVFGMLMAKKMYFIGFYDIPIRPIFFHGGALGLVLGIFAEYAQRNIRLKKFAEYLYI